MCFVMKMDYFNLLIYQIRGLKTFMDLLMIAAENKSHYVYIKDFIKFMCNKTKCKNKKNPFL